MTQNPGVAAGISSGTVVSTKTPLTAATPTSATVTGTSGQVVASNLSRKGLAIINLSADVIYLGLGTTALVNSGIALTQKGSVYEMSEYDYTTSAVNAISSGTSSLISIQEFN